ncbi:hypothetical protein IV203_032790 [Nitzschia inconspicua]|uniref:Uncharacterized protein n=1 Tax=Nitzschia inconspicua TaxID=303405 RepID=A0A9K3KK74_9STRA|nr:hypothetical protein IV203_032790 [Nitzschia inconspicua]
MKKEKKIVSHTSSVKPKLTSDHMKDRLRHCLAKIDKTTIHGVPRMKFKSMYNEIHVDEKWFYLVQVNSRCLLAFDEAKPAAKYVTHKSHITKVMFLSVVARPRYIPETRKWFDGLIGIYPVGEFDLYTRSSKNHRAGDVKWTNINMDRELYQHMILDLVLPDIKKKMPPSDRNFVLQQDGARVHLSDDDPSFKAKVTELFGNEDAVKLYTQPAQSPDLNVNDLGFFNSLQSKYYEESPRNAIEMIEMVEKVYKRYPMEKLNRIWLTLQSVMNEIIDRSGANNYEIPHMNKEGLERINELPVSLFVTEDARRHDLNTVVED